MSKIVKRKYKQVRKEFKKDMYEIARDNRAFIMMIIETYTASKHNTHIMKIWELLGFNHREAYKDYCSKLMDKHLTGRSEIMRSLCFVDKTLYEKYVNRIPERYAMGEALGVAYKFLKQQNY